MKESSKKPKDDKNNEQKQIQVNLDENIAQGIYSNIAISNFSKEEFVLDFAFYQPHLKKAKVLSRIIITPNNAKKLKQMLEINLNIYQKKFGDLSDHPDSRDLSSDVNFSFN